MLRTALSSQPEVDFRAGGRVAPMSGQKKTLLLLLNHTATFKNLSGSILPGQSIQGGAPWLLRGQPSPAVARCCKGNGKYRINPPKATPIVPVRSKAR
jgi:hypothetical protein